ncbi:rRNA-processing protein FCF1 [Clostridium tetanomorphum]|uniref:PIN domain-containing protein n=1 Tax=Clostridium tetanomorphum TaxID=1553 RepID=A0A923E8N3_CLOTT|nr:hypothetical protein [Clostridium tetanomorphum]KAJ51885.1 hypothetical protein CTM_10371 [Clostridium tetanomorphum DSM 665]MBC2398612.1 hypothetical protein [Clostridium tetanomorphum]MBP1864111.1 rRNA-processing protein FCF1 [Clostridium tetanomorphum]NRS84524.1 rRNA-processing protein FCF1 [Clostridium tetanomorphum]NRZ97738.1 rRNA-processing protein FCF1 [Clostridium tetanomorphum]
MLNKKYLLDSNIVIKIWSQYPDVFNLLEKHPNIDFKISHNVAEELSKKEFTEYKGTPVLTSKFLELLNHVTENDLCDFSKDSKFNEYVKYDYKENIYLICGNKLSEIDYNLICICEKYSDYILVTEDKKLLSSAKIILGYSRVVNFELFIEDLRKFNIL